MADRYCVGPSMAVDWGDEDRPPVDRRMLARVFGYFRPHWRPGLVVLACIAAQAVVGLAPAVVFKALIDHLSGPDPRVSHVGLLVAAGVGAAIVGGLIGVAESYFSTSVSQNIVYELRRGLFDRLLGQPVAFFTDRRAGEVHSRIDNDVDGVEDVVTETVFGLVRNALVTLATLALMVSFSWQLTLLVLLLIPLVALPTRRAGEATYRARTRTQRKVADINAYLQEVLGIRDAAGQGVRGAACRTRPVRSAPRAVAHVAHPAGDDRPLVRDAAADAGDRRAGADHPGRRLPRRDRSGQRQHRVRVRHRARRATGRIGHLARHDARQRGRLARAVPAAVRLPRQVPAVADVPDARDLAECRGAVTLDRVTFAYPGQRRPALAEVDLEVPPGTLVALVGPSGAGKTTLTTLVARFHDPQTGRVLVDGHDVRGLTLESLGSHIGIVFQDTFLFHASIADNLRYARPDATDDDLIAAARAAHLHDFIASLPDGYDTIVGERGHRLSGGEKQRVAIARVILKDLRIVILDEATSHLDTASEQLIQAALRPLFHGRTALVIAHRLSTILAADLTVVLDHGRVVERGTHTELLQRDGLYASLYRKQFRAHHDGVPQPSRIAPSPLHVDEAAVTEQPHTEAAPSSPPISAG